MRFTIFFSFQVAGDPSRCWSPAIGCQIRHEKSKKNNYENYYDDAQNRNQNYENIWNRNVKSFENENYKDYEKYDDYWKFEENKGITRDAYLGKLSLYDLTQQPADTAYPATVAVCNYQVGGLSILLELGVRTMDSDWCQGCTVSGADLAGNCRLFCTDPPSPFCSPACSVGMRSRSITDIWTEDGDKRCNCWGCENISISS